MKIKTNSRLFKGFLILEAKQLQEELADEDMFQYFVYNEKGEQYLVAMFKDNWRCDCPDYQYRSGEMRDEGASFICKHIYSVIFHIGLTLQLKRLQELFGDDKNGKAE